MLEKYPKEVRVLFKNFPIRSHKYAKEAAIAALAAGKQGKFWEFHDKIFENYRQLSDEKLETFGIELGLDMQKFRKDMKDPQMLEIIDRDVREAREAGVRGTPTIYVNGKRLKDRSLNGFQRMIEAELKKE